ncbi:MAG: 5'-methylthioadenosine/adenosylhomocysteine nucleosidase [Alphaproteobacteria bacterium]|nr:5'-methylthioadenosine/adenosylhomocysteine nucleosidase [Alphaproteobacteria bacterium]
MTIGLIVAMEREFELFSARLDNPRAASSSTRKFITGEFNGQSAVLSLCGIGKVNAALGAAELIERFAPEVIINTGIAGGLNPSLSVMDVVAGAQVSYHDVWCGQGNAYGQVQGLPAEFCGDAKLLRALKNIRSDVKISVGRIISGDMFISSAQEVASLKSMFPDALAVDMESAAIAQTCYLHQTSFLALRIISDTPGISNHYQQYEDFWQQSPIKSLEVICRLLEQIH